MTYFRLLVRILESLTNMVTSLCDRIVFQSACLKHSGKIVSVNIQ